ncbi:hypothetical protein GOV07_02195 [Candidatus Woesearchaeota archaeon]|nr:hypothetical protein [Candidatus Woesearchaeota archaeon]
MKHPAKVTIVLVALFVVAQLVGLWLVNESILAVDIDIETGEPVLEHSSTAIGERPDFVGWQSFLYLVFGVAVGTSLLLLLIKFRKMKLWKTWFFLAVFLAQAVAFGVVLPQLIALALALVLSIFKIYKPNPWVHNITEVFMYAGIAVLLVPILDVFWSLVLLLIISIYDAWAVWKSKHMVKMAEFQKDSKVFAGLMVPKKGEPIPAPKKAKTTSKAAKTITLRAPSPPRGGSYAILGGGDIAFPLLFTGAVMEGMILSGISNVNAYAQSLLITLGATIALAGLFMLAKKDRYYPAMPFLTAGCLFGWALIWVLTFLF